MAFDDFDKKQEQDDWSKSYYDIYGEHCPEFKSQENTSSSNSNTNNNNNIMDINDLRSKINHRDFIEYAINIVKKTVKCEDILVKQILYTALSSYIQNDPINLAILAPTSEGKTYAVEECMKIFPKQDVLTIGSMSTKALIRKKGILVDKYNQPIGGRLKDLRKQKETIKNNPEEKEKIAEQIKELYEDSKTLIDLTNKILVFLEPPDKELWNTLKSILSHDSLDIEFPFVNKNERDGLQTKNVVVRGWPSCIFCSAKDESKWDVWPEIKSRFLISSPNMIVQKYQESTKLIAKSKGLPNLIQEQIIVSEKEIDLAKECILAVKQNIEKLRNSNKKKISVWIPFYDLLQQELPSNRGTDVRFTKRVFSFLNVLPIIRHDQRYSLVLENETSVIADLDDLREVLSITQNFDGIPKYKKDFFDDVFYPCYKEKTTPNSNADGTKSEEIIAVTTKQLCEFYEKVKGKSINSDILKKTYLNELLNNELIDCESSLINPRQYIYYPLVEPALLDNTATANNTDNSNEEGRASIASKSGHFDQLLHKIPSIYEKIIKKVDETWLFYEIMQLISHRINLGKIKGPLADFLNNNDRFWIMDNKKSGDNNYSQSGSYLDNKLSPNFDIEDESSISNIKGESNISKTQRTEKQCCCSNNNKSNDSSNKRLTIKQFIQRYTNFSKFEFDAHQSLKWSSFLKSSNNSSKIANFDIKDAPYTGSTKGTNLPITKDNSHLEEDITDKEDNVDYDSDNNISLDISNNNKINDDQVLNPYQKKIELDNNQQKSFFGIENSSLFECYYCKEFLPTYNRDTYEKHVILIHDGKLAYPSLADLEKHILKPKGKYWEV
jgi:hypothetical protein